MAQIIISALLVFVLLAAIVLLVTAGRREDGMTKKQKKNVVRIFISAALLLVLEQLTAESFTFLDQQLFPSAGRVVRFALYFLDYWIIGHDILAKAWRGIQNKRVFDENFLMAVATVGAMTLAIVENGDYLEGIAVMLFYQIGEWFQSYAVGRSRKNISNLMDIRPDYAHVEKDGVLETVDPDDVAVGSIIVVQPGEKIPIDGTIVEGKSSLNTAALTGESLPRDVEEGDAVISGCISMTGVLKIRTSREFGESTVSKILDLVENASSRKSKSEDFISQFARIYTPAVCYSALALALLPPLVRMFFMGLAPAWTVWLYRALTFLVISCPCALVISIPLSFFAGIGGASKEGILVKGSNYLELLSKTKIVVMDKTGTLTQGVFEVNALHHNTMEKSKLLELAALAESASSHPISKSLLRAYGKPVDRQRVTEIQEISGKGIIAKVDGISVAAGNSKLMESLNTPYHPCHMTGTIIHLALDGDYAGHIVIADRVKPHAKEAVQALKADGIQKTVMLTGDTKKVAQEVAADLGVDAVYSDLLPAGKVEKVEELLREKPTKTKLAFVGDGINDAPVLSIADIGIAMGAMGSDAAIEAADVVLMDDDPLKLSKAIRIAKKCLGIVYQNIALALVIKFACLGLGALGIANMYLAIFADVGVMVIAVLNAMRCLWVKNL
ncbi:heavy metal translocating P-type ATPase [Levyella massiliensis]|uniref:heavy metal translocating P-type ATPase n=1 Tax=Levyella massiliensis TaxID=938289 RepID=UPI003EB8CA48